MQIFLDRFAATPAADGPVVLVLDRAGWHVAKGLRLPPNLRLVHLPPYAPDLVWGVSCRAPDIATRTNVETSGTHSHAGIGRATI